MDNTSKQNAPLSDREIFYFRQRTKNRLFQSLVAFFAKTAANAGVTKKDIACRLRKDPAQITRWLSGPGNLTIDTVSDLLLAMDSELECNIIGFNQGPSRVAGSAAANISIFELGQNKGAKSTGGFYFATPTQP